MPDCCIPTCQHSDKNAKCKLFRFPNKEATKQTWIKLIGRSRLTTKLVGYNFVCSCHFVDGKRENGPTIFSWTVNELESEVPEKALLNDSIKSRWNLRVRRPQNYSLDDEKITVECNDEKVIKEKKLRLNKRSVPSDDTYNDNINLPKTNVLGTKEKGSLPFEYVDKLTTVGATKKIKIEGKSVPEPDQYPNSPSSSNIQIKSEVGLANDSINSTFKDLLLNEGLLPNWGIQKLQNDAGIILSQIELVNDVLHVQKCITIGNKSVSVYYDRKKLTTVQVDSRRDLTNFVRRVDNQKICLGSPLYSPTIAVTGADYKRWRHKKCTYLFDGLESSCSFCLKLFDSFLKQQRRLKQSKQQKVQMKKMIRDKFECIKDERYLKEPANKEKNSCFLQERKPHDKEKGVDLIQMKNRIRDKFQCIKDKGNLVPESNESSKEKSVALLQIKNMIKTKFKCINEKSILDDKSNECSEEKSVDLIQMKNSIKDKFALIKEKSNLIQKSKDCNKEKDNILVLEQKNIEEAG